METYGAKHLGQRLREQLCGTTAIEPFLGVYDCFSASIASAYSSNLVLSAFGFAATYYGLGPLSISWSDLVQTAWRIRQILPEHKLLVDMADGFGDVSTARHIARQLERMGTAMTMVHDKARPREKLVPMPEYLEKLTPILGERENLCVLAATSATGDDLLRRVEALSETDADALMIDGAQSLDTLQQVGRHTDKPLVVSQMSGMGGLVLSLDQVRALGVRLVQYPTPLLFAAQKAMTAALETLVQSGGVLPQSPDSNKKQMAECLALLQANESIRSFMVMG